MCPQLMLGKVLNKGNAIALQMLAALDNVMKGRIKANFFVDEWPNFSALVCQYIWPRRSDVSY